MVNSNSVGTEEQGEGVVNYSDAPLVSKDEDQLGRFKSAESLVKYISKFKKEDTPFCISITGEWGSGKTSFLQLMKDGIRLENERIRLENENAHSMNKNRPEETKLPEMFIFNPWQQATKGQIIEAFFNGFIDHSRSKVANEMQKIRILLQKYGWLIESASNLLEPGFPGINKIIRHPLTFLDRNQSLEQSREKLADALADLKRPKIIVIDDVDRLHGNEILEVFQLVRAVMNFKNLIFLLVFDVEHIKRELGKLKLPAEKYLEKIIQFDYELPPLPPSTWANNVSNKLRKWTQSHLTPLQVREESWDDVLGSIVIPLIKTPRQLNKLLFALDNFTEEDLKVDVLDLIAIEAVRNSNREVWFMLIQQKDLLRDGRQWSSKRNVDELYSAVGHVRSKFPKNQDLIDSILWEVFFVPKRPQTMLLLKDFFITSELLHNSRLHHAEVMNSYISRVPSIQRERQEEIYKLLGSKPSTTQMVEVLQKLSDEDFKFTVEDMVFWVNKIDKISNPDVGIAILRSFEMRKLGGVESPEQGLIKKFLMDQSQLSSSVSQFGLDITHIFEGIRTLSGKWVLLQCISHRSMTLSLPDGYVSLKLEEVLLLLKSSPDLLEDEFALGWLLAEYSKKFSSTPEWSKNVTIFKFVLQSLSYYETSDNYRLRKLHWTMVKKIYSSEDLIGRLCQDFLSSTEDDREGHDLAILASDYRLGARWDDF